ncbi:MAG TPA: pitrilysin family protein, partial [Gemmatimonadaceae bacterium]|nr:pitrilysin family protein [Gemmatimonadaceae bacterium]
GAVVMPLVPAAAQGTDLTKPPKLGPPPALSLPPVVTRRLPNGLQVLIIEHHELPLLDAVLVVKTGGEANPAGRPGVANMTARLLDEGTTTRSSLEIADQEAYLGISIDASSGWDASRVALHTPTAQLDSALALFADVVLHPSFPAREFDRVQQEALTELMQIPDRGPTIASRAFARILFGAAHPYGQPLSGTEASVRSMTRDELAAFHATYFRPNNATLILVGDVRPDDIMARVTRLFGAWAAGDVPQHPVPGVQARAATRVYLIDKPGAAQSSFRIGSVSAPRSTPDYFAIQVMNTILGGAFTSRLNENLRETHGYTYGAGSGFDMRRAPGPFVASAEVVSAKSDSALIEFMRELRNIREPVPQKELNKAKRYLELSLPGEFETTTDIANQFVPVIAYGLPLDYYNGAVRQIDHVSQADVQRVARKYVDPAYLTIVIVGDRASIEPKLEATHIAPVEIRAMNGDKPRSP